MSERKTGYGAGWKKWLLVYVAVGIVVYAIVYFAFFHHGGSGGSSGGLYTVLSLPYLGSLGRRAPAAARSAGPRRRG